MNLDINTARGQESLLHEREVQDAVTKLWKVSIIETPKLGSSKCDGFLVRDSNIIALFETKCRYDMTYSELLERGSWLITNEKIQACKLISKLLQVPFIGFLYLRPTRSKERIMLFWKITDNNGEFCFEFDIQMQETQKTINGGKITRKNAYLPVDKAEFIKAI